MLQHSDNLIRPRIREASEHTPGLDIQHLPGNGGQAGWQAEGRGAGDHSCCSITGAGADSPERLESWTMGRVQRYGVWRHWGGTGDSHTCECPQAPREASPRRLALETCLATASQVSPWEQPRLPAGAHSPAGGWWQHEGGLQLWHPADVLPRGKAEMPTAARSRNNHEFGVSCAVTHCKLCTWYPQTQDCTYSLFLILGCPFPARCAHSPCWQMHSTGLLSVCRFGYRWGTQTWTFISSSRD